MAIELEGIAGIKRKIYQIIVLELVSCLYGFELVYVFTLVWNNEPDEDNAQARHKTLICTSHSCVCSNSLLSV